MKFDYDSKRQTQIQLKFEKKNQIRICIQKFWTNPNKHNLMIEMIRSVISLIAKELLLMEF